MAPVPTDPSLTKRLLRYSAVLGILIASAIGLILSQVGGDQSFGDQATAIGLNLVSSALFALLFSLVTSSEQERWLSAVLRSEFDRLSHEMQDEVQSVNELHVPIERYAPTESFDERFNQALMQDLGNSSTYVFRGVSAKYVPARVHQAGQRLTQLKVITLDPSNSSALLRRAADRRSNPKYSVRSLEQIKVEIADEISMALVALFDCRTVCSVEVALIPETAVQRVELFDASAYVAFYHSARNKSAYPETMRYGNRSLMYATARLDAYRRVEISDKVLRFSADQQDSDLLSFFADVVGTPIDEDKLETLRERYRTWSAPFVQQLTSLPQ